jgi:hypothetical protein
MSSPSIRQPEYPPGVASATESAGARFSAAHLSDKQLLDAAAEYASTQREATAALIAALAEIEGRSLHLAGGYDSLYSYCREALRLSEHAAYARIEAARKCRDYPVLLDLLASGALTLTTVGLLCPVLRDDNHGTLIANACYRSKREVAQQLAALRPPQAQPVIIKPVGPDQYVLQFTVSQATHDRLRVAQDLLRHQNPDGDVAAIFDKALALLIKVAERRKWAATDSPRGGACSTEWSRHIPAAVRRAVWNRDGGQCAFIGTDGRCSSRTLLEFHHLDPFAIGGEATIDNIQLRCRPHNVYEAALFFGIGTSETFEAQSKRGSIPLGPDLVDGQSLTQVVQEGHAPAAAEAPT